MTTDEELKKIRERKAQQLMKLVEKRKQRMEELKETEEAPKNITDKDKIGLMEYFLTSDAFEYWFGLYNNENKKATAETIFLNVLYMIKIGYLEGKQITRIGIKKLERKIEGIPPSITIKRKGEKERTVKR
ncbi:MAG: hypothetical protein ACTSSG_02645 [Candidatus Heimdallarchaeaceae archaeon]